MVVPHADDEAPVAPILARYAREGVQLHIIIATDGGEGTGRGGMIPRSAPVAAGEELAGTRAAQARCASEALGIHEPVLLGFPDGRLGDYAGDPSLAYRLTQRIAAEIERLRPQVVLTWGPDGGTGHPDHRVVSTIVTQLQLLADRLQNHRVALAADLDLVSLEPEFPRQPHGLRSAVPQQPRPSRQSVFGARSRSLV